MEPLTKKLWHKEKRFSVEKIAQCSINKGMHMLTAKSQKQRPDTI